MLTTDWRSRCAKRLHHRFECCEVIGRPRRSTAALPDRSSAGFCDAEWAGDPATCRGEPRNVRDQLVIKFVVRCGEVQKRAAVSD